MAESGNNRFKSFLAERGIEIKPFAVCTLWLNITHLCNQACRHCHVGASSEGREHMTRQVMDRCLEIMAKCDVIANLDITGGAPELNPDFEYLVVQGRNLGKNIMVRHNLSVILDGNPVTGESMSHLPQFFAENKVHVLASLPACEERATDLVRGKGVFRKSIQSLRLLNNAGYGDGDKKRVLDIVCNVDGPVTSARRAGMEREFRRILGQRYGIMFNSLLCVTNMPINRYRRMLDDEGYQEYMELLVNAFDAGAVQGLVCRNLVSIGHDGRIYDCDFNQALGLKVSSPVNADIFNWDIEALLNREILLGNHCFGCTAGGGSS